MTKDKKKTLTISSSLKKKIDTSTISTDGKKSFSIEKKKFFKAEKASGKPNQDFKKTVNPNFKKKKALLESLLNSKQQKILSRKKTNLLVKVNLN